MLLLAPDRRMRQGGAFDSALLEVHQRPRDQRVDVRLDDLRDLVAERLVDGVVADEGVRLAGAPPMEVVARLAPIVALPLPQSRGDVPVAIGVPRPSL